MDLYTLKAVYLACCQQFFPDEQVYINTIYTTRGKNHDNFEELLNILKTEKIDTQGYFVYCFSNADKRPTIKSLGKAEFIQQYKHEHNL